MGRSDRGVDGVGRLGRTIWAVSLPLLLVEVGETVIHVTDTAFLGRVGTTELAALALGDTLLDAVTVPVVGLAEAMQIVVARRVGQRRTGLLGATFRHAMVLILIASAVLALGVHLAAPLLGDLLAEDPDVAAAVAGFLGIAAYGVVPNALSLGYAAFYVGLGRTAALVGATAVLAVTNLVLSYALILGELGRPALGIEGAAWAFVGAESLTFVFLTLTVRAVSRGLARRAGDGERSATGPTFRPLLRLAPPVAAQGLLESLRWLVFFVIVEQVSEEALAWSNIAYACYMVLLIPSFAVGESASALVSTVIGQGRAAEVVPLTARATRIALAVTAPMAVVIFVAPEQVAAVFTDDEAGVAGAAPVLRVLAVAMLLVVPAEVWLASVAGTGATDVSLGIETVLTVVLLASAYGAATAAGLSLAVVWASVGVAALVALLLSRWWLVSSRVRHLD